jgi:DNA polymerase III delta prime subunit
VTDYAAAINLICWVPAMHGIFGWPSDLREAELVRAMRPGDAIVPKFAQSHVWGDQDGYQRDICAALGADFDRQRGEYDRVVGGGAGAVPFVMRVSGDLPGELLNWDCVAVDLEWLEHPISTSEFLRMRAIPLELAGQFKAMAAPGRRIQALPPGTAAAVRDAGRRAQRGRAELRTETLVHADDEAQALDSLRHAGLDPIEGDRAFVVSDDGIAGLFGSDVGGGLRRLGQPITVPPRELLTLLREAARKARASDYFTPGRAYKAAEQIVTLLDSGRPVEVVGEFGHFHDRFVLLDSKVTQALEIAQRLDVEVTAADGDAITTEPDGEGEDPEQVDLNRLNGLTVEAVEKQLGSVVLPRAVLAEAVTALRSGKHLLLSGPPGTGKSTVATALARAVVESRFRVTTATADWTAFDTIGGYLPQASGELTFEPGLVLRALDNGSWLVIDELNRADIDKAFGPLFTLLAGSGNEAQEPVQLPFRQAGKEVTIGWAPTRSQTSARYAVTPAWRLLGTMNVSDKASLFQLSFAFLRRFAVVEVPLPERDQYEQLLAGALAELPAAARETLVATALRVAFGPVPLGPAIMLDVASFTERGLVTTTTGRPPYDDPLDAFLTALRLYAVPQYEGADDGAVQRLLALLSESLPQLPAAPWAALERALGAPSSGS